MAIIRTNKVKGHYARISHVLLQDESLTWEARGLASYLLSKPPDWRIEVDELIHSSPAGRKVVYRIIIELVKAGYIIREKNRKKGRFKADYYLYETKELAETHVSPMPVTGTGHGHRSRTSVTDIGNGHRLYKEEQTKEEQTKEEQTKDTQTTDDKPPSVESSEKKQPLSRHSFEILLKWAKWQKVTTGTVRDAELLAKARIKDGIKDDEVDLWLKACASPDVEQPQPEKRELPGVVDADLRQKLLEELHVRLNENTFARWFAPIQEVS